MKKLVLCLVLASALFGGTLVPELETILQAAAPNDLIAVVIQTVKQGDLTTLPPGFSYDDKIAYLQAVASEAQQDILAYLGSVRAERIRPLWLTSRIALKTTPEVIRTLARRADIEFITDDFIVPLVDMIPSKGDATDTPGWNILKVKADSCWALGYTGAGIVVSNIDTGVEASHPAFHGRWRSSNGWYDAVNGQPSPYDDVDHGTHTMGTICGGDGNSSDPDDIGVAPGATFIAAKAFTASGGSSSDIDACFNWMASTGHPDLISNSWGGARTETYFWTDVANMRALGIICIFSIGNATTPPANPNTSIAPGSFPIVISAGATTSGDDWATFSLRGTAPNQSPWSTTSNWPRTDWNRVNPSIGAPGDNVRSCVPGGGYSTMSGTSMACPTVAGCVALMLQLNPNLTPDSAFNLITRNADLPAQGAPYPNDKYGWGRLNCKKVLDAMAPGNRPNVQLTRTTIINDANGNGMLDPGETANLVTYLRNTTGTQATSLHGVLRTSDAYVTVTDSLANYGNLAGHDSTNNLGDLFGVRASGGAPGGHVANMTLYLACSETAYTRSFTLTIGQPVVVPGTKIWGPKHITGPPDNAGFYGIAYNPTNDRLYTCHFRSNRIWIYSSDSSCTPQSTIPTPNNDTACTDIKYCAYDNTFWVADNKVKKVFKISATGSVLRSFNSLATDYPVGLGWDEQTRRLYQGDRRALGVQPAYIYVSDTLGAQIARLTVPLTANAGPRCIAVDRTNSNPNAPTLINVYTAFNAGGTALDSVGVYEYRSDNCAIQQRFLSIEMYNLRGVEYDPRDASLWCTIMQEGSVNNEIIKYAGFHQPTGLEEGTMPALRDIFGLTCYPNPFRRAMTVHYELRQASDVQVTVHDAAGRTVASLVSGRVPAGQHDLTWSGRAEPGVYFINLRTPGENWCRKVIRF